MEEWFQATRVSSCAACALPAERQSMQKRVELRASPQRLPPDPLIKLYTLIPA